MFQFFLGRFWTLLRVLHWTPQRANSLMLGEPLTSCPELSPNSSLITPTSDYPRVSTSLRHHLISLHAQVPPFSALFRFCCANVLKLNYVLQRFLRFPVQTLMVTDQLVCLGHKTPACGLLMCCGFAHLVVFIKLRLELCSHIRTAHKQARFRT